MSTAWMKRWYLTVFLSCRLYPGQWLSRPVCLNLINLQDCEDDSESDGMKRERSMLLLASLASDALDGVLGVSKVGRRPIAAVCSRKKCMHCQSLAASCFVSWVGLYQLIPHLHSSRNVPIDVSLI